MRHGALSHRFKNTLDNFSQLVYHIDIFTLVYI